MRIAKSAPLAAALLVAVFLFSASATASHTPDGIVALSDDHGEQQEPWPPEEEEELPGDEVDIGPPPDDEVDVGDDPPDELPTYDLFLEPSMTALWSGAERADRDGTLWFPLVRTSKGVEVGKVIGRFGIDLASTFGTEIDVVSDHSSQRPSRSTTLVFRTRAPILFSPGDIRFLGPCRLTSSGVSREGFCDVPSLLTGSRIRANAEVRAWGRVAERHHRRTFPYIWNLVCHPPVEWDCANNRLTGRFGLAFPPKSETTGITNSELQGDAKGPATKKEGENEEGRRAHPLAGGSAARTSRGRGWSAASAQRRPRRTVKRADRPAGVEIALVKLAKRQRGFSGAAVPAELSPDLAQAAGNGKRQCSWLANRKREFKKSPAAPNNVCDTPVWLKAKLKKPKKTAKPSQWRFRFKKRLRPGRYVLYSKTTTRRGVPEMAFTKRRGNRVGFRVRKRR